MLRGYLVVFIFWGYFGHFFQAQRVFLVIFRLKCTLVFLSFQGISVTFWLRVYIGHFLMPRGYLIHFQPSGAFWSSSQAKGVFLVIFRFRWFFGLFLGFNGILVFFQASKVYQFFFMFREYFSHLQGLLNYILLILVFFRFQGYFGLFQASRIFWSFFMLQGVFQSFFGW